MPIPFACPHCQLETLVDDDYAGQTGRCAGCDKRITVPYLPAGSPLDDDEVVVGIADSRHKSILLYVTVFVGAVLAAIGMLSLLLTMLFPAIGAVRAIAQAHACTRNLVRIGAALQAYEAEHGSLPPARIISDTGVPMHSWRVLILPYLGEEGLYRKYHFNEPWDSPHNRQIGDAMPAVFACPADPNARALGETNYVVIVGPETLFPGTGVRRSAQIGDDPSSTIMVAESPLLGYPWTQPLDLQVDAMQYAINGTVGNDIGSRHIGGAHVLTADGEVRFLSDLLPADFLQAMTTMSGGEPIPIDLLDQ